MYIICREHKGKLEVLTHANRTDEKQYETKQEAEQMMHTLNAYRLRHFAPWFLQIVSNTVEKKGRCPVLDCLETKC
ncbi:hypothetical protein [Geomicrobium sp. JCM 19055]|uniref:hypothetical protein n=1 Tax=Geomicrobium sp. JCM 19055 TaxID=1460649 RepID=UPI00045ED25D|nr:hypothetical protein [Geomicrobium sp. JCM 19055]GAJ97854.1 hypothetical protein JCM19055_740 [Geomicrobium sp. JCM 19055]